MSVARRTDGTSKTTDGPGEVRGARLEPIRVVERELTRPDGTKLRVKVPVYPPFRLEERQAPPSEVRKRKPADKKAS